MTNAIRYSYPRLLVKKASARTSVTHEGNGLLDTLAASRGGHTLYNLSWWDQPTLNCYSPTPRFYAAHSLLADNGPYPAPKTTGSPYPSVVWAKTAGTVSVCSQIPDGAPHVAVLKIMDDAPPGTAWGVKTAGLGTWEGGLGATKPGQFGENQSVALTLRLGTRDTPPAAGDPGGTDLATGTNAVLDAIAQNLGSGGDRRVTVGNLWSVLFPGDGGPPAFEKKFRYTDKLGATHDWVRLHTFTGATPSTRIQGVDEWLVAFCALAGRLTVSVTGRNLPDTSFCYFEQDPVKGGLKALRIPPAAVTVTGRAGGGPTYVGIRRIGWGGFGQLSGTLALHAALASADDADLSAVGHVPPVGTNGIVFQAALEGRTTLRYTATVPATDDDREPCTLKWVYLGSPRTATAGDSDTVDYAGALTNWTEKIGEPDFSGAGGTRGSDTALDFTFDKVALDLIAAENDTDWRADLAAYAPFEWVLGVSVENPTGVLTDSETTRVEGYLEKPSADYDGFGGGTVKRAGRDSSLRLKDPAGFVGTDYHALDVLNPGNQQAIHGSDGVAYILGKAIDPTVGEALEVHMPADWPSLFNAEAYVLNTGRMPANDVPLWNPPYGKDAAAFLKEVASFDYAALFWRGKVPVYGQYPLIVAAAPTHEVYDGTDADGLPVVGDLPDEQQQGVITAAKVEFRTEHDFNDWLVWGSAPGGVANGADATGLGVPLVTAQATDFVRVRESWRRTKLLPNPGRSYDAAAAAKLVALVKTLSGGTKAASGYSVTLPWAMPDVFWGHKLHCHTPSVPEINGKTLRVLKQTHKGDPAKSTVRCEMVLIELLEGE